MAVATFHREAIVREHFGRDLQQQAGSLGVVLIHAVLG